jgi:hypothetical protein
LETAGRLISKGPANSVTEVLPVPECQIPLLAPSHLTLLRPMEMPSGTLLK